MSAASGGNSEPKQGQRSQSARGFCPRSTMRVPQPDIIEHFGNADAVPQLPERCLSRKAGSIAGVPYILQRFDSPALLFLPPFQRSAKVPAQKVPFSHPCLGKTLLDTSPANCMAVIFLAAAQHNILGRRGISIYSVRTGFQWDVFQGLFNLHAKAPPGIPLAQPGSCFDPCTIEFLQSLQLQWFPRVPGLDNMAFFLHSTLMIVPNPIILLPR